ncbi:MAG: septum formation protein Maf [Flavobacteriaceae bacterium]|nr:septum formation protein Maf [Flavobacteriaceae bacterium]
MALEGLKKYNLILASGSPRRHEFLKGMNLDFRIQLKEVEEVYDENLKHRDITDFLAKLKASVYTNLKANDLLITSDTIVWYKDKALGKPKDRDQAYAMLKTLSDDTHEVISSVCFTNLNFQKTVHDITKVEFKALSDAEIYYYIDTYKPYDKAGGYGIQDWIGIIGVTKLEGSYNNVMGSPTHLVYKTLMCIANS